MGKCPYRVKNLIERQNPRDMDREKSVRNLNLRGLHVLMTWVHENFQKDWGDEGGDNDHQNDGREERAADEPGLRTLLRNDQGDLAAGNHAKTDDERIMVVEPAQARAQTAADDLAQDGNHQHNHRKGKQLGCESMKFGFDANGGEKNWGKEHIGNNIDLFCEILAQIPDVAQDDARKVSAGNIRDAEYRFSDIRQDEAERKGHNGNPALVAPNLVHMLEYLVHDKANQADEYKKQCNADKNRCRTAVWVGKTGDNG